MGNNDDSEKDVHSVRFVSGRGQNPKAFQCDIELGVHAGGKHITHTRMMDTAISECDKRFKEKLNGWRQLGCPSAALSPRGVLDVNNTGDRTLPPGSPGMPPELCRLTRRPTTSRATSDSLMGLDRRGTSSVTPLCRLLKLLAPRRVTRRSSTIATS